MTVTAYALTWRGRRALADAVPKGVGAATRPIPATVVREFWDRGALRPRAEDWTGRVDVVHATNFVAPPARAPVIVTVHDVTFLRFPELCTGDTLRYPAMLRRALERGATIHTPSEFVAAEVRELLGAPAERVEAIHSGIPAVADGDPATGAARAGSDRYILTLGTVEPRKNLVTLVRAFDRVAAADATIRLVLAGPPGWDSARVQSAIDSIRGGERVVQLGFVSDADRANLLAGATLFAYPSVYEGFGFPPLEAMQCGIPVVAGAAGALPEVLGDAASLVDPMDVDAFERGDDRAGRTGRRHPDRARPPRPRAGDPLRLGHDRTTHGRLVPERGVKAGLHTGQLLQPVPGGIGRYVVHLARNLPAADVGVVCFGAGVPSARVQGLIGTYVNLGWPRGPLRYEMWHQLRRPRVRLETDLIHAPSLAIPPTRQPLVVTVHDVAFLREPSAFTRRGLAFHRRGLTIADREAAAIVTASRFARDELVSIGFERDRIHLAPHGVEVRTPEPDEQIDARIAALDLRSPFVLAVGTVEPRKGLDILAQALDVARARVPGLTVAIVGPPGWLEVAGLDAPGIRQLGTVDERTLDALYRRALVCAVPSRYEGFGLPALEAMARGCPVVASNATSLPEVVGSAGTLVPVGDVESLARALVEVAEDREVRDRMAELGRARAAGFTWQGSAHAHAAAYAAALEAS